MAAVKTHGLDDVVSRLSNDEVTHPLHCAKLIGARTSLTAYTNEPREGL